MSFFIIRGGFFGFEYTYKVFWILVALAACIYDWRKNKRRDYFWVFLIGSFLYIGAEVGMFFSGARTFTDRFIFGIDISNLHWFTIPVAAIADVPVIAVFCLFIGDRLMNKETRKAGWIFFSLYMILKNIIQFTVLAILGYKFTSKDVGNPDIFARRDMLDLATVFSIAGMVVLTIVWLFFASKDARKRVLFMFLMMVAFMSTWSLGEWLTGQRWIETGADPTWTLAIPAYQFAFFAYDIVVEMGLFTLSFLAILYIFRSIRGRLRKDISESKTVEVTNETG